MNHTRFLQIALPVIVIPALIILFLPAGVSSTYVSVSQPLSLLIGSLLALYVSFSYRKQLKAAFIFLSAYLFIYMLAIILFTHGESFLRSFFGDYYGQLVLSVQALNYFMLFIFCINVLKVVNITHLDRNGWIIFGVTVVFSVFLAVYPVLDLITDIWKGKLLAVPATLVQSLSYILIRLVDAGLIIVLTPVVWLYIQYLKSQQQQSLTFTVIVFGIVCATLFDYLCQSVLKMFPQLLATESPLRTAISEMLYLYGYSVIAVGLYAHFKEDEWGYNIIDKAMGGISELVGGDDR